MLIYQIKFKLSTALHSFLTNRIMRKRINLCVIWVHCRPICFFQDIPQQNIPFCWVINNDSFNFWCYSGFSLNKYPITFSKLHMRLFNEITSANQANTNVWRFSKCGYCNKRTFKCYDYRMSFLLLHFYVHRGFNHIIATIRYLYALTLIPVTVSIMLFLLLIE